MSYRSIYDQIDAYRKDSVEAESGKLKDSIAIEKKMGDFACGYLRTCMFKAKCGFEEGGGYSQDLHGWDFDWLFIYSNRYRKFCEEILLIVSDWKINLHGLGSSDPALM